jgi:hypothetical protein
MTFHYKDTVGRHLRMSFTTDIRSQCACSANQCYEPIYLLTKHPLILRLQFLSVEDIDAIISFTIIYICHFLNRHHGTFHRINERTRLTRHYPNQELQRDFYQTSHLKCFTTSSRGTILKQRKAFRKLHIIRQFSKAIAQKEF